MRKFLLSLFAFAAMLGTANAAEKLNRAPVAVNTSQGILVSWRYLSADGNASYEVKRNGTKIATVTDVTNYLDADGKPGDVYSVTAPDGTSTCTAFDNIYSKLKVTRPAGIKSGNTTGRYIPDDMSVADLDGDGNYELVLKWMPDNQRDNGSDGYSSPCILDAYKVDWSNPTGKLNYMWRINLGLNIRSGNHYTQFLVYDFDGDGKAEMICKTAPGSLDGQGKYVSDAATDATIKAVDNTHNSVNSKGRILTGDEYLTVFNGQTGAAMHTVWYNPNRGFGFNTGNAAYGSWGDTSGNRGERFNACVAYLDGTGSNPSAIMQRGYYTRQYMWAVDWDGTSLKTRWLHRGTSKTAWDVVDANNTVIASGTDKSSYGQGVHAVSVGDVDGDGKDEICIGAATIDDNGSLLCSTGMGHGDAIHLADLVPSRPGLEVMMPHEESPYGYDVHDATTGEILASATGTEDNGRGIAGDFIPSSQNSVFWSSKFSGSFDCGTGASVSGKGDTNFRIYWTGDPFDQTFDGHYDSKSSATIGACAPTIGAYSGSKFATFMAFANYGNPSTCNTTKATPCLQADILGDWREELIMYEYESAYTSSATEATLLIYSTPEPTAYKVPCLMEDHVYRMGIAWQNSSYNQPPHLGYNLANSLGINRSTYKMQTTNHAPTVEIVVPTTGSETISGNTLPSADKEPYAAASITVGKHGELTASASGGYLKMRTNMNGDQIVVYVNEGYIVTGISISARSNNTSTTADRSIDLTGIYVDGSATSVLTSPVTLPGGTAGQTPVTAEAKGFEAASQIALTFDNSKITSGDIDSAGKNKQIFATITVTYKKADASGINTISQASASDGQIYNVNGQRLASDTQRLTPGTVYIKGGKKYVK